MNRNREVKRDFLERVSHKWAIQTKWYQAINPREGVYLSFQNLGDVKPVSQSDIHCIEMKTVTTDNTEQRTWE